MYTIKVRKYTPKAGYTLSESISKVTLTNAVTKQTINKLDSYPSLRGVKIINQLNKS